ncbi:MAG: hypothetical protein ACFFD2_00185 [Promethearchaeota archaeon]
MLRGADHIKCNTIFQIDQLPFPPTSIEPAESIQEILIRWEDEYLGPTKTEAIQRRNIPLILDP